MKFASKLLSGAGRPAAAPVLASAPSDDSFDSEDTLDSAAPAPAPSDDYFITDASALDSASPAAAPAAPPVAAPAAGLLPGGLPLQSAGPGVGPAALDFLSFVETGAPMPAVGALPCCWSTTREQLW